MSSQFLIVTVNVKAPIDEKQLKATLDVAIDWVQYMPGSFLLKTTSDASTWYTRLKAVFGTENQFLITKADPSQQQGWISEWVWDWIRKNETQAKQPDASERPIEREQTTRPEEAFART